MLSSDKVKEILSRIGVEKVLIEESSYDCVLALTLYRGREMLIAIVQGEHAVYAKIVPAESTPLQYWKCGYIEYMPTGLYAFAKDLNKLVDKLKHKMDRVAKAEVRGIEA